jgi:hypothetical protein
MNARTAWFTFGVVALAACEAELGGGVLVPESLEVSWDRAFDAAGDGLIAVLPFDVYVYDAAGRAVPGVDVELVGEAVGVLDLGEVQPATAECVSCAWDTRSDTRVWLQAEPRSAWTVTTDGSGLARCYVVVDRLELDSERARAALSVTAFGVASEVLIVPR